MEKHKAQWVKEHRLDPIPGGVGANLQADDVNPLELEMGIQVEMEHVKNALFDDEIKRNIAMDIALDHLSEIKDYYTRLNSMEKKLKIVW